MAVDPWAGYNQGMQSLGQTFDTMREEQRQAPLRALQLRILQNKAAESDIAAQQAQVSAADRLALRQKLASAEPVTTTQIMPLTKAATALTTIPGAGYTQPQGDFAMPTTPASPMVQAYNEGRVKTTTQQPDLAAIARQELLRQGNIEEAAKAGEVQVKGIAVDDILAKKRAEIEMYGSPEAKAKLDVEEARLKTAETILATSRKADPTGNMTRQMIKAHPELFPSIDPDQVTMQSGLLILPFNGGKLVMGPDNKSHIIQDQKLDDADKYVQAQKSAYKAQTGQEMGPETEAALRMQFHRALKPETNIKTTIVNKEQTEEAKTVGKGQGERYNKIVEAGDTGFRQKTMYSRLEQLLNNVETGKMTPMGTQIAAYAASAGLNIDKTLPNKQAAQALSNQLALELRNPAGGAGMPGAMSDKDREFLVSSVPGLSQTPSGNKMMIQYAKAMAQRSIDVSKLATEYRQKHGTLDVGFNDELQKWSENHPLFVEGSPVQASQLGGKAQGKGKPSLDQIFK